MADSLIPIANDGEYQCDPDKTLFLMWAGDGLWCTQVYVWADHFEDAFEELVEYLDEHAPGHLTQLTDEHLKEAAEELGLSWPIEDRESRDFGRVCEKAEEGYTVIGHTTLKNGSHIASHEWGGAEVTDPDERQEVSARSDGKPRFAYGNGEPGCLFDNADGPFETIADAAAAAAESLELTDDEKSELQNDGVIYFRGDRRHEVGASMIQIFDVEADWTWE